MLRLRVRGETMKYGMLINYEYCTGCQSCEISCRKEKDLTLDEWGIKINQLGPEKLGDKWEWDYVPVPSSLCDMCEARVDDGKKPLCALHCLAHVIEVMPVEKLGERISELEGTKTAVFTR